MSAVATEGSLLAQRRALPVQKYAKVAGVLVLLSFVAGGERIARGLRRKEIIAKLEAASMCVPVPRHPTP
jgi:hypothetical protein